MAHHTIKSSYEQLTARLNSFPQGAPPSAVLYQILSLLFSEREAELVAQLPLKPFTVETARRIWQMDEAAARHILDALADRAILLDIEQNGQQTYVLPPPMAGFFEFSLMRVGGQIDQKVLAELYYQYLNVEEDFGKALFANGDTQMGRVFVQEAALSTEHALYVLDYERASAVIQTAAHIGIGVCYCRHKMSHLGQACAAPLEICMTFGDCAASLIKHGYARRVDAAECMDLLHAAYAHNLVQFGENVRERVSFICNCCGCCCEALVAARRFAVFHPIHTTNFMPHIDADTCNGCGKCVLACPVEALSLVSAHDPHNPTRKQARLNAELCLGCGVCVRTCPTQSVTLQPRPARVITPLNTVHRTVLMAIERGKLQNLIFDNRALWSHRAMAAILGVILRLPPAKQLLANQQVKSRYLEAIISRLNM